MLLLYHRYRLGVCDVCTQNIQIERLLFAQNFHKRGKSLTSITLLMVFLKVFYHAMPLARIMFSKCLAFQLLLTQLGLAEDSHEQLDSLGWSRLSAELGPKKIPVLPVTRPCLILVSVPNFFGKINKFAYLCFFVKKCTYLLVSYIRRSTFR